MRRMKGYMSVRSPSRRLGALWVVAAALLVLGPVASAAGAGASQIGATVTHGHAGEGAAAGQLNDPRPVAADGSSSLSFRNLYVADQSNRRIDSFSASPSSGAFNLAWGSGVRDGKSELQTCTTATTCREGVSEETPPFVTGGVAFPDGIAVDSDPLSSSVGDVYVAVNEGDRVEKFGPEGEFLLTFGGHVNKNGTNVCKVGEECQGGTQGSAAGEFQELGPVAGGPGGLVYVADSGRVQVFESSGAFKEAISLAALSTSHAPTALAVDPAGDLFVAINDLFGNGVTGVREFKQSGGVWSESSTRFDEGSESVASIAVDLSGDLFVGDTAGGSSFGFHVLEYAPGGEEVSDFASGTVRGGATDVVAGKQHQGVPFVSNGMAFSEASGSPELYVSEFYREGLEHEENVYSSVWVLPVPPPGPPVIEEESATPGPRGSASLQARVNPEGAATEYHFQYVSETEFDKQVAPGEKCEWKCAASTATGLLPKGFKGVSVSAKVSGLAVATSYRYRALASNGVGAIIEGEPQSFQTLPAVQLESEYTTDVAATSATVNAQVNALESPTRYRVQYGTSLPYDHEVSGDAGHSATSVLLEVHLHELSPGSTYHYRFVLENELGGAEGPDRTFITEPAGVGAGLPDGRAYEQVTPAVKLGTLIEPRGLSADTRQAASDGGAITYQTTGTSFGEGAQGKGLTSWQLSSRKAPGAWRTADITLQARLPGNEQEATEFSFGGGDGKNYQLFSEDLTLGAVEPAEIGTPPLSPEATERTLYVRDNRLCASSPRTCFTPLVSPADVPPGTRFGGGEVGGEAKDEQMHFVDATPDLGHVLFASPYALTPEAHESFFPHREQWNFYEWSAAAPPAERLKLVNVLPDGEATPSRVSPVVDPPAGGYDEANPVGLIPSAVSADGSRIAWNLGLVYFEPQAQLFVRDMVAEKTVQVGGPGAAFEWMSADGAKVFYLEGGDLRLCEPTINPAGGALECVTTDLTAAHGAPAGVEQGAGVQQGLSDVSRDGSSVYFVATSVLAGLTGPVAGQDNLYLLHDGAGGWSTSFIATLSREDQNDWWRSTATNSGHNAEFQKVTSRVSPDGRYLTFMSERPLTGYDNVDAVSGQRDEELFLYHAPAEPGTEAGSLVCASCNPTGARPHGVLDSGSLLADGEVIWSYQGAVTNHWLAAFVPGWDTMPASGSSAKAHQPRYLSNSGRLFFDSPDALVPQDTNGLMDVYEYEPPGVGGCTGSSSTFGERSGGCVSLISNGTSGSESAFVDASANGDDVFFLTASRLVAGDHDTAFDIYDAHVCGAEGLPCASEPVQPPACSEGEACKGAPAPQPELFGAAPSATFSGAGNLTGGRAPNPPVVTKKTVKCRKGKKLSHGKCVKQKSKKRRAKKAGHGGRTK
jgi:WD40-like Beta Propeller Repeat